MRVLITGAAGYVGRYFAAHWQSTEDLELVLADIHPLADDPRFITLDLTDAKQTRAALENIDAVIHLAKQADEGPMEGDELNGKRFDVNVKGTFNLLEAARAAGVKRFIFTSTVMTVLGYTAPQWVESDAPPLPVGSYALTKQLCEVMCQHYARAYDMSIICLRIPKPIDLEHPLWKTHPLRPQWVPFPDLLQAYQKALTAEISGCEVITIVGESSKRRWDLSKAEKLLGYRPTLIPEELGYAMGTEDQPIPTEDHYA
ncbi:NAD-dependent epimerase/dehydratase family protein [Gimesia maris]|uniref:3 beta-hydroxysteroid dehydrogenase/Delta 5-->4-isomerase n=1 Tax=Gimesia maris TaxID=122 RepID=A0ABX5YWP3_9PLAN|nr:NAD(P)-dependent oxidoreductase [Gimesia maris]EDL60988.1 hypothetical protein PM8797T_09719 [Gimesia maris DSM 8797]QEG20082.1 3 beta-hydroxysteroid dehydrogenase/Delta 5-->4-isomerase [Gimesia maris]QGQ32442.1 NAD(P)-dependent oxidoreductase [Gimesia maris]